MVEGPALGRRVKDAQVCGRCGKKGGGRRAVVSGCGGAAGGFKGVNTSPVTHG